MKPTRNMGFFVLLCSVIVLTSFVGLDKYLAIFGERNGKFMLFVSALSGLLITASAGLLLKYEDQRMRFNLGVTYHIIAVFLAMVAWLWAYLALQNFQPIDLAWIVAIGGGSLILRLVLARKSLKGINKKVAFK